MPPASSLWTAWDSCHNSFIVSLFNLSSSSPFLSFLLYELKTELIVFFVLLLQDLGGLEDGADLAEGVSLPSPTCCSVVSSTFAFKHSLNFFFLSCVFLIGQEQIDLEMFEEDAWTSVAVNFNPYQCELAALNVSVGSSWAYAGLLP